MKVADLKRAACVGGGVIGSSWAIQFAMRGLAVTLYDINDEQLKRSEAQMHKSLDALEQFNAITPERRGEIVAAIRLTTGVMVTDPTSGMRMFNREMIREFALNINYGPEPDTVSYLLKQGAKIAEVPVRIAERAGGESYLKPVVAVRYMARILISILLIQNFRKRRKG